jgi:hypothetical protein
MNMSFVFSPDSLTLALGLHKCVNLYRTPAFYKKQKLTFLLGTKDQDTSLYRFKNDALYDYNMCGEICKYLQN